MGNKGLMCWEMFHHYVSTTQEYPPDEKSAAMLGNPVYESAVSPLTINMVIKC